MKVLKEWFISAPWGKIALISWGNPNGEPVLLVHGRQDSAATFIPLLELLPDKYHYVGIDFPGHGKSDPFPKGVLLMRSNFMAAIHFAVEHLHWKEFVYVGHSMGSEQGLLYNVIHPNKIKKLILLDPRLSLPRFTEFPKYFQMFHEYSDDKKGERVYSKRRALEGVMKTRGMTEEQAEIILSRNLTRVGDDLYKLSWDKRLKEIATWNSPPEYFFNIYFDKIPPTLVLAARRPVNAKEDITETFLLELERKKKNYFIKTIDGGHDLHFKHPERIAEHIRWFLDQNFDRIKSKI